MAIYHCSIKIISRGKCKSAVAAAAYRSGGIIKNEYDGITHDYTRKRGIVHTEILLPDYAPREYADRSILWNTVEKIEKSSNAQLAREIEVALPVELTAEQNISLVREYCKRNFVSAGMCADVCIHDKNDGNPHAHIMLTMRPFQINGCWAAKQKKEYILDGNSNKIYDKKKRQYKCKTVQSTDWNEQSKAEEWRAGWADMVNNFLTQQNVPARIDHRSYSRQGLEQIPTVHLGVAAMQMERCGIVTSQGNRNREINNANQELRRLRARIRKLEHWLKEESTAPNLQSIFAELLSSDKSKWQRTADLKTAAKMLIFLQKNNLTDMTQLTEKVADMRGRLNDVLQKLKTKERRLKTLSEHIKNADIYLQHKAIYKQYMGLSPAKQDSFRQKHERVIILFESSKRYLDAHLNGHALPLKEWKSEAAQLTAEKDALYKDYYRLKEDVQSAEAIKRTTERMSREIAQARGASLDK